MKLSSNEVLRYSRQMHLGEIGIEGQKKIKSASVLIVGVGGLGSPAALALTAAGVGRLGLIDGDRVELSNLQRQTLPSTLDIGRMKVQAAAEKLRALNPEIQIDEYPQFLTSKNALSLFKDYEYILDGADNFPTRFLVNDAAFFSKKILISASVLGFESQLAVFDSTQGACYRCLYPEPPPAGTVPSCAEAGVLGAWTGVMGSLQALTVLKIILNLPVNLKNHLWIGDSLAFQFQLLKISKNPDCPLCGLNPKILDLKEENFVCSKDQEILQLSFHDFEKMRAGKSINILDVRDEIEWREGHFSEAHHIPLKNLEERWMEISREIPVVVHCKSGQRSLKACHILKGKGFEVYNLVFSQGFRFPQNI